MAPRNLSVRVEMIPHADLEMVTLKGTAVDMDDRSTDDSPRMFGIHSGGWGLTPNGDTIQG